MPKIVDRVVVRERIDPGITASLFSNYRSSADAVLELIDNSMDSFIAAHHNRPQRRRRDTWRSPYGPTGGARAASQRHP
jgi:hypothetical protein